VFTDAVSKYMLIAAPRRRWKPAGDRDVRQISAHPHRLCARNARGSQTTHSVQNVQVRGSRPSISRLSIYWGSS
jgi:hypothetical protein